MRKLLSFLLPSLLFFLACEQPASPLPSLQLLAEYPLSIPEPSGLSLAAASNELWLVSDRTSRVYRIDTQGRELESLSFKGDDLEGISFDPRDSSLWVVEEIKRELVHLGKDGTLLNRFKLVFPSNDPSKGLEGVSFAPQPSRLMLLNEADPGMLFHTDLQGQITDRFPLNFADDYSGLFAEPQQGILWILSDESQTLSRCSIDGKLQQGYQLGISKAEGIAIDRAQARIYIVSDSEAKLYVYELPN